MRSSITMLFAAGALALAGAAPIASAAEYQPATTTGDAQSAGAQPNYKAEREQCKKLPGSDQAGCQDAVGMRAAEGSRVGQADPQSGSLTGRDKCAGLNESAQRDCLMNDKAGGK